MPGSFWGLPRNSNNNSSGTSRPLRRRRSLLGRKIHSENDLPLQDPSSQQQQQQPPHTIIGLPENVKTILIAGTPECWNLTTSATPYSPTSATTATTPTVATSNSYCDATSVATTINEDEPYINEGGGLNWLLLNSSNKSTKKHQSRSTTQQTAAAANQQEPSSMIVMYKSPGELPPPEQALNLWLSSVGSLLQSDEMTSFMGSTRDVIQVAGGMAIRTVCLPVTMPLHVACATRDFVGRTVHQTIAQTTGALSQLLSNNPPHQQQQQHDEEEMTKGETNIDKELTTNNNDNCNPYESLFHFVPVVLGVAGKIKDEIGAAVLGIVTPPNQQVNDSPEVSSSQKEPSKQHIKGDKERLEQLKLPDYSDTPAKAPPKSKNLPKSPVSCTVLRSVIITPADFSKYLLRVEDLGVGATGNMTDVVLFLDLGAEYRDKLLLNQCLDELVTQGLALATSRAPAIPPATPATPAHVEWKPEGTTAKMLRKKALQTPERWEEILRTNILMWSGTFHKNCGGSSMHRQTPLFLARGVVDRKSPRDCLEMLWDNRRTCEYNFYCLGREDVLQVDDKVLSSKNINTGTKVVKSETRVPFTGLSVTLCTMMHCRPLPGGPEEGYIIVSRSLLSGMAGSHTNNKQSSRSFHQPKSEILWGINVFRSVPGHPDQTDLTSLSQVASAMVPKFLSQKIGVMGVEDFFYNVRNPNPKVAAPLPETATSVIAPPPLQI